ncbi:MAG TPA: hypothetical protein ENJ12_12450 [Thiolapillus brandeum]|uniref:Heme biosynthesis operon protein HemX n=1 Tax=Thiolapillus brandeum TaxID=1076588 RepID=A0A831RXJ9_9GAMM|nr:hypothetical protein [Thiolapillus brandeum]
MKQKPEHQTVVIDMNADEVPLPRPSRLPAVLALLALLVTAAAIALSYHYWQNLQQDLQRMAARSQSTARVQQELQQSIRQAQQALEKQQALLARQSGDSGEQAASLAQQQEALRRQADLLTAERNRMQQREVELRATIADLRKRLGNPDERWLVAEAEYLLQLAVQRLQLARDTGTALAALQQADQRLEETGDARWQVVREQLRRDMDNLQRLQLPDVPALLRQMDALKASFARLRPRLMAAEASAEQKADASAQTPEPEGTVSRLGKDLWRGLQNSVRIRHHDRPVETLLTSGQEALLVQNAGLMLETARLALVQGDDSLYRESLQRLDEWLKRYFHLDDRTGQQASATIQALMAVKLKPELPDLSESLKALQTRRALQQIRKAQEAAQ